MNNDTSSLAVPTARIPGLTHKLGALATGAAALGALAPAAHAALTQSPTIPVGGLQPPLAPQVATIWDVDDDGTSDFALYNNGIYANLDDRNGGRLVVPAAASAAGIAKLPSSFEVGPTLVTGFKFHAQAQSFASITFKGGVAFPAASGGWAVGDTGFFGFEFVSGGVDHFGFGILEITGSPVGAGYKILNAWYGSDASETVHVEAVPEAGTTAAMLAMGAAGVLAWRRQRRQN